MSITLAAASIAAAVIHFALGPEHVEELGWLGLGFYLAGLLQLGWVGLAVAARARGASATAAARAVIPAGIAINGSILAAWVVSRTVGLPAGAEPWTPEAIGISDTITALLEGALILGLALAWRRRATGLAPSPAPGTGGYPSLVGAAPILALILVATVTAVGTPHAHAEGADHDAGTMTQEPHGH